jgi:hypothetical protein
LGGFGARIVHDDAGGVRATPCAPNSAPQTAPIRGTGGFTQYGPFNGMDTPRVMQEISLHESISQQSRLAAYPERI